MSLSRRGLLGLALALPAGAARAAQTMPQMPLIMATGRAGTPYARYGTGWGSWPRTAGLNIDFHASNGAVANILLIERNAAQLGIATTMVGAEARLGRGQWTAGVKFDAFRVLFPAVSLGFADRFAAPHRHHQRGATGRQTDRPQRPWRHRFRRRAGDPRRPWPRRPFHHHRHVPERPAADGGRGNSMLAPSSARRRSPPSSPPPRMTNSR